MSRTLRDLVGQSVMLSFAGPTVTPDLLAALTLTRAAGFVLFADNIASPGQLYDLNRTLQAHAAALGLPPLLIAVDQEGGIVSRLPAPFVTVPSQMAQAATGDPQTAYTCARITGRQLRAFGINTNFAPVLDINCNPRNPVIGTRSFGARPDAVIRFGLAAIAGYRDAGVIATAKHFPGHGDTDIDSHLGLPTVRHDRGRLDSTELAPFVAAFADGVSAIMTAHIIFEALDPQPATLSPTILRDLLRDELGYDGLVFTDSLAMRAIAAQYGPIEAGLRSKAAGADVLLPCGELDDQISMAQALLAALEDNRMPRDPFTATAQRLDQLRAAYDLTHTLPPFAPSDPALYDSALDVARRSITILHDPGVLPLARSTRLALIDCTLPRFALVEEATERADLLRALVTESYPQTTSMALGAAPDEDEIAAARALAESCAAVLLVTRNAALIAEQARLAETLAQLDKPLIHVAARSPYDSAILPNATTLLTYGDPLVSLQALVDVIAGRIVASGTPPVALTATEAA